MPTLLQRFSRIAPYFRQARIGLLVAFVGSLVGAITEPMIPALLEPLLDVGFGGGKRAPSTGGCQLSQMGNHATGSGGLPLWAVPVAIIGLFTVRGVAGFLAQYALSWAAQRGVQDLRRQMFQRVLNAGGGMFGQHSASSLTNTLVYEVQSGATMLINSVQTLAKDSLTLVALLLYLFCLNWRLTLFVAVLFPAVAVVMKVVGKRLHRLTREGQEATDQLAYVVEENVLAWRIVRMHGAGASQASRFERHSLALRRVLLKIVASGAAITPLTQIFAAMALSAVIVVALWQSNSGGATVGSFVAFITAMLMLVAPIKHLSDVITPMTRGLASIERGLALLDDSPAEVGGPHAPERAQGAIELNDVSLRYRDDQASALDGLTLRIQPGEIVALVGPSGAGKSSLINLLPRFIEPSSGDITLDGVALPQWDVDTLRRQFAMVSQDVVLFNDSIAANIALGHTPDPARVQAALQGAHLAEFVAALPQGMHSLVGHNGSQLSGGQRQRLAIARALYKNAPILILDEATSALDSESERAVQAALDDLMRGRTTLVIAHRLSTIEHAHRIVVMDAGQVAEQGTHAELLAKGGLYARLHAMQFRT